MHDETRDPELEIPKAKPWIRTGLICAALVLIILVIYGRTYWFEYLNYDDAGYVFANVHVPRGLDWDNVVWAINSGELSNWHPLTWLSLMLDVSLFGMNAGPQHAINVMLHTLNTILLFLLLRKMTRAEWASAFVAALFAIHPLHIESVAWIGERKDVLSTFFWFLTLWAYLGYVKRPGVLRYLPVLALFCLGLMTKPMLVTVPAFLLLLDFWPLKRLADLEMPKHARADASKTAGKAKKRKSKKTAAKETAPLQVAVESPETGMEWRISWGRLPRLALEKLPMVALAIGSSIITMVVQQGAMRDLPLSIRLGNAIVSYVRYIAMMFWPVNLAILYPHPEFNLSVSLTIVCLLLLAAGSAASVGLMRRFPYVFVGWWWYLGTLVPVIGIIHVGAAALATRYTYVPIVGLFILIAWSAIGIADAWKLPRTVLFASAAIAIAALMLASHVQIGYWKDSITLFTHNYNITGSNYLSNKYLGMAYIRAERYKDALPYFEETVKYNYNDAESYIDYGGCLVDANRIDEAVEQYKKVFKFKPDHVGASYQCALALAKAGRYAEAVDYFEKAKQGPSECAVYVNLAEALVALNRMDEAVANYRKGLELNPDETVGRYNLGNALAQTGRLKEAIEQYRIVLEKDPGSLDARMNLGNAYAMDKQPEKAAEALGAVLQQDPDNVDALVNLGNVCAEQQKWDDAVSCYTKARKLAPNHTGVLFSLAFVLERQGKPAEAVDAYSEVLRLQPGHADATAALTRIQTQLDSAK